MSALAARQLAELAEISDGAVQVLSGAGDVGREATTFLISLDTHGIETANDGIHVRARERFRIEVSDTFPATPPTVCADHHRWAGTPHVQWRRQLCLYAAPAVEWNPSDGMRGLISRLNLWLQRAAAGELDPDGQPLHPPAVYSDYANGSVILRPDIGNLAPWATDGDQRTLVAYARCVRHGSRIDVLEWLTLENVRDLFSAGELSAEDSDGRLIFFAPLILVSDTLDMEYPDTARALVQSLTEFGFPKDQLLDALVLTRAINSLAGAPVDEDDAVPVLMLLGTPARRVETGGTLAHITAWNFDSLGARITNLVGAVSPKHIELSTEVRDLADEWLQIARIRWMVIHEARPEVTNRRDTGSPAEWLRGKRVLVLGAGALGGPIAEHCVRAGVARLHLVDKGAIGPGILVRQPYADADIGYNKAEVLAAHLSLIRRDLAVTSSRKNAITGVLREPEQLLDFDLIIDATADVGVRIRLESVRAANRSAWPVTVTALFGHTAQLGVAVVSRPEAAGGGHDVLRRLAIDTSTNRHSGWAEIASDLFPNPPRTERFFPEPGCSAPTFTGSSVDTVGLASALFGAALSGIATRPDASMLAVGCDLTFRAAGVQPRPIEWPNDHILRDQTGEYEVRITARAMNEMRTEARRGRRVRGDRVETGGMLLGSLDDATATIYVDSVSGPSPDSRLSRMYFDHGTEGTQELIDAVRRTTADRVGFVGMWHTHPFGSASPSETDELGMSEMVAPDGTGRRALMMILGGAEDAWRSWLDIGEVPPIYARVVERQASVPTPSEGSRSVHLLDAAPWFPGGYGYRLSERLSGTDL